jgi:hypothetical protein
MRLYAIITVAVAAQAVVAAQENAPIGILRGDLVAWSGTARAGVLTFRNSENHVLTCSFDNLTWFEHENSRVVISGLQAGDHLELVADRKPPSANCYARTVQVLDAVRSRLGAGGKPRFRRQISATETWAPRGDMTFSGIVAAVNGDWLSLRLRDHSDRTLLLRQDTRYLGEGLPQQRSSLTPQKLIFVRAGRNLDGDIEAYTIMWGDILHVRD